MIEQRTVVLRQLYKLNRTCEVIIEVGNFLYHPETRRSVKILEFNDPYCLVEHVEGSQEWIHTRILLNPIGVRQTAAINGSRRSKLLTLRMRAGLIND